MDIKIEQEDVKKLMLDVVLKGRTEDIINAVLKELITKPLENNYELRRKLEFSINELFSEWMTELIKTKYADLFKQKITEMLEQSLVTKFVDQTVETMVRRISGKDD